MSYVRSLRRAGRALLCLTLLVTGLAALPAARADELELTSGRKYQGKLVQEDDNYVVFEAILGGRSAKLTFPRSLVRKVTPGPVPTPAKPPASAPADPPPASRPAKPPPDAPDPGRRPPSVGEVEALIARAGKTTPEWWDSVPLQVPQTLDLAGTKKVQGWQPQVKLGAHWYSVINPNPSRWKPGVKLLDHVVSYRSQSSRTQLPEALSLLARSYVRLMKDWARGAYWYRQFLTSGARVHPSAVSDLAECYWRLGSPSMATVVLRRYGLDRVGCPGAIRIWAEMGHLNQALAAAEGLARGGQMPAAYLAAGNACRQAGKLKQALTYYDKVAALPAGGQHRRYRELAAAAAEAIRLYESLDLSRIPDNDYTGESVGFRGPVRVKITIKGGRIESVEVARHREDMPFTSITDVPGSIVAKQGLRGVDTITGATVTSEAIISAAAKALGSAPK